MKCPNCDQEVREHEHLGYLCPTGNCPVRQVWLEEDDVEVIAAVLAAAWQSGYDAAREQAQAALDLQLDKDVFAAIRNMTPETKP